MSESCWQGHLYCKDEHMVKAQQRYESVSHYLHLHRGHKTTQTKRIAPGIMTVKMWLILECSDCKVWWVYDEVILK